MVSVLRGRAVLGQRLLGSVRKTGWAVVCLSLCLLLASSAGAGAGGGVGGGSGAQAAYPAKAVEMIVPFAAGGGTDIVARTLAKAAQKYFGQPIVIANVAGAGGAIGTAKGHSAAPDGYTVVMIGTNLHTLSLQGFVSFPYTDFEHVAGINIEPFVLAVRADGRWRSFKEFADEAKANPGAITVANAGTGALTHLAAEAIATSAGIKVVHVPFSGGATELTALLGGHVAAGIFSQSEVLAHVGKGGKLLILGVTGRERSRLLPDVPTFKELGMADVPEGPWRGVSAPKGTPAEAVAKLADAFEKACKDPEFVEFCNQQGYAIVFTRGSELAAFLAQQNRECAALLKKVGAIK